MAHEIRARNYFDSDDDSARLFAKSKARSITDNSIEYRTDAAVYIEPGQAKAVNGRTFKAGEVPLKVATKWALIRNSLVLQGADPGAKMRQATGANIMDNEQTTQTDDTQARQDSPAPEQADDSLALVRAQAEARAQAVKEEQERIAEARTLQRDCNLPQSVVDQMIDGGWDKLKMRDAALAHLSAQTQTIMAPMASTGGVEVRAEHYQAAVAIRGNQDTDESWIVQRFGAETVQQAREIYKPGTINQGNVFAQAAELAFRLNDVPVPHTTNTEQLVREALGNRSVAASTMALPKILTDTATISALKGYQAATGSWRPWCVVGRLDDFLTHRRAGAHVMGEPQKVVGAGQIEHTGLGEQYADVKVDTYAQNITVSRQDIRNDQAGALTRLAQMLGASLATKITNLVYSTFMANGSFTDGTATFHANHNNLNTSAALASSALTTAVAAFLNQTGLDGQPISVSPRYLLAPPTLFNTALGLLEADRIIATDHAASASTTGPDSNVFNRSQYVQSIGLLTPIVEPRLENSNYTNSSTSTWYMAADPNTADTVEVSFLDGIETPTVAEKETDINQLAFTFQGYIDVGVSYLDYRAIQKNTA
tara:strand:+ start:1551 stop:3341 length:1791 start_codon:yes stop_codon:yes gene_type:complete